MLRLTRELTYPASLSNANFPPVSSCARCARQASSLQAPQTPQASPPRHARLETFCKAGEWRAHPRGPRHVVRDGLFAVSVLHDEVFWLLACPNVNFARLSGLREAQLSHQTTAKTRWATTPHVRACASASARSLRRKPSCADAGAPCSCVVITHRRRVVTALSPQRVHVGAAWGTARAVVYHFSKAGNGSFSNPS